MTVNSSGTNAPMSAQLVGYKDAQWTSAAFALMGEFLEFVLYRERIIDGYCNYSCAAGGAFPPQCWDCRTQEGY